MSWSARFSGHIIHVAILLAAASGCDPGARPGVESPAARPLFVEVTAKVGLNESPAPYADGRYQIPEISPGGAALFDYDDDGDLDIYQVRHPPPDQPLQPAPNRLFRQEASSNFTEVPGAAGLNDPGYGNGVAVGDIDSDGDLDVFVANLGPDRLYRNGSGAFIDITAPAGIREDGWSTCAAFFDYDRDGDLDLYVTRYLVDDPSRVCRIGAREERDYCGPSRYQSVTDLLFRNDGGAFTDVSAAAGIALARSGFGVFCVDLTGDGWADIYVANDMQPNQLYVNQRDGTFIDLGMEMGAALSGAGKAQAGMGVAVGDVNGDRRLDLAVTNLADQTNTLYLHTGSRGATGAYIDRSASSGLGAPSFPFTAWGCGFADFDLDGDLDFAVANGRIARGPVHPGARVGKFWNAYAEPNQLFLNQGGGRFIDASSQGGEFTAEVEVSRGLALGDLDRDGDVDLVLTNIDNSLRVFYNQAPPPERHWLEVRALTGKRDALGALITLRAGDVSQVRPLISAYSFSSASEPVAHFGLGEASKIDFLEVAWPDGALEQFEPPAADRRVTLRQGSGKIVRKFQ